MSLGDEKMMTEGRTQYVTKDSGDREEYDSGMVRDTNGGKPRFDLVLPEGVPYQEQLFTRIAELMARGAQKYGDRNWEKATGQAELNRAKESAFRHFMQWYCGETDEDHAAAVFFNIQEAELVKSRLDKQQAIDDFNENMKKPGAVITMNTETHVPLGGGLCSCMQAPAELEHSETCRPGMLLCCSEECEQQELARRRKRFLKGCVDRGFISPSAAADVTSEIGGVPV